LGKFLGKKEKHSDNKNFIKRDLEPWKLLKVFFDFHDFIFFYLGEIILLQVLMEG